MPHRKNFTLMVRQRMRASTQTQPINVFVALDRRNAVSQPRVVRFRKDNMTRNEEHPRLLSIFHYVVGGFAAWFTFFPICRLIPGGFMILAREKFAAHPPAAAASVP